MDLTTPFLIRGAAGIAAGLVAMLWPQLTLTFLVLLFGAYAFIDGVANVFAGVRRGPLHGRSGAAVVQGLIGIAAGMLTVAWPNIAVLALVLLIAAWAIVTGVFEIAAAIRLREQIRGEWLLAASGALSVILGATLVVFPAIGALALAWVFGAYAVASGILVVALAMRLRTGRPVA